MKNLERLVIFSCCIFWSLSAVAQVSLEENMNICMGYAERSSNNEIVDACTSLIDAAQAENETIGYFYAMRAIANSNRNLNCSDGRKAKDLVTNPKLIGAIDKIISNNC